MSGIYPHRGQLGHSRFPRSTFLVTMLAALWLALAASASAQDEGAPPARDYVSCGHFETQEDAQEALDSGLLDENGRASLDGDGDGIACEHAFGELDPDSPPPARDYVSCGHFESQADAQEALDSGTLDENGRAALDGDGDGIACEIRWGEPGGGSDTKAPADVTALPKTGTGTGAQPSHLPAVMIAGVTLTCGALLATRRLSGR